MFQLTKLIFGLVLVSIFHQFSDAELLDFMAGRYRGRGLVPPPPPPREGETRPLPGAGAGTHTFTQPLDHFNSSITQTWEQRYQVDDSVYRPGGAFFVMIGGESAIDATWLSYGQMYRNAKTHGAMMFQPEHRFYGDSHPTSDVSISNLKYLTTLQALADLDNFINGMKNKYNRPDAKVVVFGGSYPGNLVVWYRTLYPDSTVGGVASSAPVLSEVDFIQYMETVGEALKYYDVKCYDAVSDAFKAIQDLVAAKNNKQLSSLFDICGGGLNYNDPYAIEMFYLILSNGWKSATQYNQVGDSSKVAAYCKVMTDSTLGDPLHRYSELYKTLNPYGCLSPNYQGQINYLKGDSWTSQSVTDGMRQWMWQACNEWGYLQSTDAQDQPFGFKSVDENFLANMFCAQPFGLTLEDMAKGVTATNARYGGKSPNVKKVFWLNGSIDPWHKLSVYEHDLNSECPSRYIEGTSHCYDMYEAQLTDPAQLTKARADMAATLSYWLGKDPAGSANAAISTWALILTGIVALLVL